MLYLTDKSYKSEDEETMRRKIFEVNVEKIKAHNKLFNDGAKSYYLGVNQFTDLVGSFGLLAVSKTKEGFDFPGKGSF